MDTTLANLGKSRKTLVLLSLVKWDMICYVPLDVGLVEREPSFTKIR